MAEQESLGELIRRRRAKLGLTQARLAELVGRSPSAVRSWERDRNLPADEASLAALVAVLGLSDEEVEAALAPVESDPGDEAPPAATPEPAPPEPRPKEDAAESPITASDPTPSLAAAPTEVRSVPSPPKPSTVTRVQRTPSYLDDPDEVNTYRIRTALTVILLVVLFIILAWAFSEARDAFGSVFGD